MYMLPLSGFVDPQKIDQKLGQKLGRGEVKIRGRLRDSEEYG